MLEGIRKRRNSVVILIAFAAIIVVFIFWGVGPNSGGEDASGVVATVDGESIGSRDYANLYKREIEYYRNTFKEQFTEEMAERLNLKKKALDILINRLLAIKEAKEQGIDVTDKDVQDAIKAIPAFSSNGAFDKDLYFKVLSSNRINPAEFEGNVEADLITSKIRDKVLKDVIVSEEDVRERYFSENRKIDLSFIAVDISAAKGGITVTDEEAKAYLQKNASEFMAPARVNAFYAFAGFNDFKGKAEVTSAEVKEYYEKNKGRFETPAAVKARHILIRSDAAAADKEKARAEARRKIDDILKKVKSGSDFATIAKKVSQDPGSARQGGELGWFQKGVMIKAFEEAAFALNKNEVSGVVETEFGYHVIKVEEKKDAGLKPVKEVEPEIKEALAGQKAVELAREALTALDAKAAQAKGDDELKKIASSAKGFKAGVTGFFSEDDQGVELARNEQLKSAVFTLNPGEGSRIVETEDGAYLLRAVQRQDARVHDFKDVASVVKGRITEEKAGLAAREKAVKMLDRLKAGEDMAKVAGSENLKVASTGYFSRTDGFMPRTGLFVGDKETLFKLDEKSPYFPEVLSQGGRHYVLKFAGVKEAQEAGLDAKKEEIRARVLAEKQDEVLGKWLAGLRENAKIKINEGEL
ncbi:MAG TPA: hypothetical protein DDW94_00810 [Deltaproteobacteria bacterium]|nr:MAG: hypothetical protein A2Z79_06175 [Deltaproteobacteria bacterium GWA2_55_82]OGQ62188.1 MAG: hypothetical protein A3I81_11975 [Deltaproteobacteria bacterium RIFCSPLOWO2_02_FULL_55_12]OIJ73229.1 MAG: hypothetical protein A2V21_302485 [Deltaproteobacteria bacterium GWC2_55_46]HBG45510.1 hypothetical protein [Deltaproteobacteria bacterium]HCY10341.1 hypothetical protein [Deltaproteobacteria bacterium]